MEREIKMKRHQRRPWIVLALLMTLLPRSGRAEVPSAEIKLQEQAKGLFTMCPDLDQGTARLAGDSKKALENDIKAALAEILDDPETTRGDLGAATRARSHTDKHELKDAISVAGQISSLAPSKSSDWYTRLTAAEKTPTIKAALGEICNRYCGEDSHIDACAFRDLHLARVAAAVDPASVEEFLALIDQLAKKAGARTTVSRGGGAASLVGALTTTKGLTELAVRLATALGKLAIDRAKQEGVLWALDRIGDQFCGNDAQADPAKAEIRTYWLPQLCRLATEENLQSGFGAGQAMASALVSAVEEDAKHMPGAAAGLIVGLAYWSEDTGSIDNMSAAFDCAVPKDTPTDDGACGRLSAVRLNTAAAIDGLLGGKHPIEAARSWSESLDEVNRVPLSLDDPTEYVLEAPLAQLSACGVALAVELSADAGQRMVLAPAGESIPEHYHVVAVLASSPACWTLTGKGRRSVAEPDEYLALDRTSTKNLERLSTIIRLHTSLKNSELQARDAWAKVLKVVRRLQDARKRFEKAVDDAKDRSTGKTTDATLAAIAKLDPTKLKLEDMRALIDEAKLDQVRDRLSTAFDVAEELLVATDAAALLLEAHSDRSKLQDLLPGLQIRNGESRSFPKWSKAEDVKSLHDSLRSFRRKLADVRGLIDALREILAGDWATGTTKALSAAQQLFPRKAALATKSDQTIHDDLTKTINSLKSLKKSDSDSEANEQLASQIRSLEKIKRAHTQRRLKTDPRNDVTTQLGELVGFITAILSAKDSNDMAVVLEKTASPPGSWRRKQAKGAFTVSIGSHVGIYTAVEFRWGQYGVKRERGTPHWQAFTLAVPIGFDFAWGKGRNSVGFFAPLIDPAAFLQYDVSEKGRLPGPRPLTVLSPGAFFRWGICRTPITLLAGYVYRPRLRTWEATVNEPGADAHQIGVSLAIDATFWNVVKR